MAIGITAHAHIGSATDTSSITLSITPTVNLIYIAFITTTLGGGAPSVTSMSSTNLTLEKVSTTGDAENDIAGGDIRVEVWVGKATGSGSGETLTIALDGTTEGQDVSVVEVTGSANSTALAAIAQAVCATSGGTPATSMQITLAGFGNSLNRPVAFGTHPVQETIFGDFDGGYSSLVTLGHASPGTEWRVQWNSTTADTDPDFSLWGTSSEYGGIALEIVDESVGGGTGGSLVGDSKLLHGGNLIGGRLIR